MQTTHATQTFHAPQAPKRDWGLIIGGIALAVVGAILLFWPGLTMVTIATVAGVLFLAAGAVDLVNAFRFRADGVSGWAILNAILDLVLGILFLVHPITGAVVLATEGELHQILYNLAENAIKYNRPGGRVRVTAEPGEESTILTVEDNGIGIPAEDLSNVFKRFYRVDKARSRAAGGTGLGLSIVSDTVSRRGGAIRAENVEGGGTRFIVTLPSMERGEEEL